MAEANLINNYALPKSGGTMTGDLILNEDPTQANQAATKNYVDMQGGSDSKIFGYVLIFGR